MGFVSSMAEASKAFDYSVFPKEYEIQRAAAEAEKEAYKASLRA
jgi:hypothetical protein